MQQKSLGDAEGIITGEGWRDLWSWWSEGVDLGAKYMLITSFDGKRFSPLFLASKSIKRTLEIYSGCVYEVYDLSGERLKQMYERRAWNGPKE